MTRAAEFSAASLRLTERWHTLWASQIGRWLLDNGLRIVIAVLGAVLIVRFINWGAHKITRRLDRSFTQSDALVRSEASKHRQALASVVSWFFVVLVVVITTVHIIGVMGISVGGLAGPAAVLGGALGFGAQRVVQDLLSGFFLITEKQYGFGDLVELEVQYATAPSRGTVEEVTLRVTKLRSGDGEVITIPNGLIVKSVNLSKDWARAVVDIPVPTSVDLARVNDVLFDVCQQALVDRDLSQLLLDAPSLMGVESIEVGRVNVRMVARSLPGKQFEVGRRLRAKVIAALAKAGVALVGDSRPVVRTMSSSSSGELEREEKREEGLDTKPQPVIKVSDLG
ncbi:MAG: mechanosensitive ion channel family protein [Mycobacterium sp.]